MQDLIVTAGLDVDRLARAYAADGRVRIYRLLQPEGVAELYDHLCERQDWWRLINTPDGVVELDRTARAELGARRVQAIDRAAYARVRCGFQYRYEALRVPGDAEEMEADDPLSDFAALMSSEPMLTMLRAVTGDADLSFSDGHATSYGPGDFLTCHDDDVLGKNRRAAYVFGMTPHWKPEYGGLLMFHDENDLSATALVPGFNTLDLFAVPRRHSVSMVTPAAPARRYAVTGWLRSGARPADRKQRVSQQGTANRTNAS